MVCANTNCNSSNRSAGWFVVDSGGNLLAEFKNSVAYILVLTAEDGGAVTQIALTPDGYNRDKLRYIFSVCRPGLSPVKLGVTVELSGRAHKTEAINGVHKLRLGSGDGSVATEKTLGVSNE